MMTKKSCFCLGVLLLLGAMLPAQLAAGDAILLSFNALTHIRGGTAVPVVPVPGDGNPVPTFWGDGSIEWVEGTNFVLAGADTSPFELFLLDFSSSLASPISVRLGMGVGGIRDIDIMPGTGDALILQNVAGGSGQLDVLPGPVTQASVLGAVAPWATLLPINNQDYLAIEGPTSVLVGGVANIYRIQAGTAGVNTALAFGTWFYSCESIDIDPATGYLYAACFNQDYVRQLSGAAGGTGTYGDLGNILQNPEIDGPDDVEFDPLTNTIYAVARNGGSLFGVPWGVQTGYDNAIIGNQIQLPPGSGYTALGPQTGHGNTGLFANIAIVGNVVSSPAMLITTGTGCTGTSGVPLALNGVGLPQINNINFAVSLSGGPSGGVGYIFLAFGLAPAPIPLTPTCNLYMDLNSVLALVAAGISPIGPLPLDPTGGFTFPVPVPNDPNIVGASIDTQAAAPDAIPGGLTTSNALTIVFGN